ncbi:hypothetical protein ACFYSC_08555 [Streptosporangium sp. NPDC004379]|uniref:hypothetical protein n=1 Tax=Streptosporangium sp. NPDC004379 TaxID=3366189 RepID=UPI0036AD9CF3
MTTGPDDGYGSETGLSGSGGTGSDGYRAEWEELRNRSLWADDSALRLDDERHLLSDVFFREGNPLGSDQYGAALEKNLYTIREGIFGAFYTAIGQAEDIRDGLRDNASTYESAESATDW